MKAQIVSVLFARLVGALIQAAVFVVLARSLGPADFGVLSAIIVSLAILAVFADCGAPPLLARAIARKEWDLARAVVRLNRRTSFAMSAILFPALYIYASDVGMPQIVCFLAISVSLDKNVETLISISVAEGSRTGAAINLLLRRISSLVVFVTLLQGPKLDAIVSYVLAQLMGQLLAQLHCWLTMKIPSGPSATLGAALKQSLPFLMSNVSSQARNLDVPVAAIMLGPNATGVYAAASRLSSPLLLISGSLATSVLPHLARAGSASARRTLRVVFFLHIALTVFAVVAGIGLSVIVDDLLGPRFNGASLVLIVLLAGIFPMGLASVFGAALQGLGDERYVAANSSAWSVALVLAMVLGAEFLGALGIAYSILVVAIGKSASLIARAYKVVPER